jgi:hypothetical protein
MDEQNNVIQNKVTSFLSQLAQETKVSKNKAKIYLARKLNERSKLIQKRKKHKQRMRQMVKDLSTIEVEIAVAESDIANLEQAVEEGSDGEDN